MVYAGLPYWYVMAASNEFASYHTPQWKYENTKIQKYKNTQQYRKKKNSKKSALQDTQPSAHPSLSNHCSSSQWPADTGRLQQTPPHTQQNKLREACLHQIGCCFFRKFPNQPWPPSTTTFSTTTTTKLEIFQKSPQNTWNIIQTLDDHQDPHTRRQIVGCDCF